MKADPLIAPSRVSNPVEPTKKIWTPAKLDKYKLPLASLLAEYLIHHEHKSSHKGRLDCVRLAIGADAVDLEGWIEAVRNGVRLGYPEAQRLMKLVSKQGDHLKNVDGAVQIKLEDAEIRKHGVEPVPVRMPRDPRNDRPENQFLGAAFLVARRTGSHDLEKAAVQILSKRFFNTGLRPSEYLERIAIWASDNPKEADDYLANQRGLDRVIESSAVGVNGWFSLLVRISQEVFGRLIVPIIEGRDIGR